MGIGNPTAERISEHPSPRGRPGDWVDEEAERLMTVVTLRRLSGGDEGVGRPDLPCRERREHLREEA
jgi:hypothetical protein